MRSVIALAWGVVALALVGFSIAGKENLLESGRVVLIELAPVDPRSLMQGDYMALRFRIANEAAGALRRAERADPAARGNWRSDGLATADGRIVAAAGADGIAQFVRIDDGSPLGEGEILLRYRVREGQMKFATNAFFFEEGTANRYEPARYGEFRVAPDGELLLTGLRDKTLKPL